MNELINITVNDNHEPVVSGRDLHKVLEIKTQYTKWLERMSEYGFVENEDFMAISQKRLTAQGNQTEYTDHILKLDMAKEIAMLQRNEKSKQVRKYFIQIEKDFNSPEKIMARALLMADKKVHKLEAQIEADRPKVLFADAVSASHASILVGELAKLLKQNGVNSGKITINAEEIKVDDLVNKISKVRLANKEIAKTIGQDKKSTETVDSRISQLEKEVEGLKGVVGTAYRLATETYHRISKQSSTSVTE
ncbi:antA/AntB antirepressor family protein [Streptococcus pyogenes]|uniref:antA/AntB antirepressor family protein n=1 Tax=Streptococcus pyogenes TaxID=1314 RepID=UPI001D130E6C|nr:antA/AntB antirepressor family protein [Streptococcus pyogenes]